MGEEKFSINNKKASIVFQFIVYTQEEGLYNLLNTLADNNLNIYAFYISEKNKDLKVVFIISNDNHQSLDDVTLTRDILSDNNYNFSETKVVKFLPPSKDAGTLAYHYRELIKTLTVFNSYITEDGHIIYETCCPTKTLKVLIDLP